MLKKQSIKNLFKEYLKTSEAEKLQDGFQLKNFPELLMLMESSSDPGSFMELVLDHTSKLKRKDQGIFYTSEPIAEMMFRRALEVYKKNNPDSDIKNIKVLDPACGSGEFILAALKVLREELENSENSCSKAELTQSIICNNLYGIDCSENAVKLLCSRLENIGNIKDFSENFIVRDVLDFTAAAEVFDKEIKFDIVIGNPPYVSYGLRNVGKLDKYRSAELRKRFPFSAEYKITLYALFMEFALNSTAENGVHSFIVPDSFLCGQYFTRIRNFMLQNSSFEYFYLIKQKLFSAVPGRLVVYTVSKKVPSAEQTFQTFLIGEKDRFTLSDSGYKMLQSSLKKIHRQRFRLFFDKTVHDKVKAVEEKSVCKLGDLLEISSGLIARHGKSSIVSSSFSSKGKWFPGLVSGKEISCCGSINYHGNYINIDQSLIKSGLKKIDYSLPKILIRQTGDHIVSAVDRSGLLVLNNIHVGIAKNPNLDLERLSGYLNSQEMRFYYQAVTLEENRPLAQIDLETLRDLPLKEHFMKCSVPNKGR